MTTCRRFRRSLYIAAIAALGAVAGQAHAQMLVDTSRANDASNRVGSGGFNDVRGADPNDLTGRFVRTDRGLDAGMIRGNQLITGNVTGFRHFRGPVPYTDPREFRGPVGGSGLDRFIADSSGIPPRYGPRGIDTDPRPFYGAALATPPPAGFTQMGFTGVYTPAPPPPPPPGALSAQLSASVVESRLLGTPLPGEVMMMPGPVDPLTQLPAVVTASPLMGVRQWDLASPADRAFLSNYSGMSVLQPGQITLAPHQIMQMRLDVARAAGQVGDGNLAQPAPLPFETPETQTLESRLEAQSVTGAPLTADLRPQTGMEWRMAVPPAQQSGQYAELQRRLDRYYTHRLETDEERNRELIRQLRAREQQEQQQQPGQLPAAPGLPPTQVPPAVLPVTPGVPVQPGAPTTPDAPAAPEGAAPGARAMPPQAAEPDYGRISQQLLQQPIPAAGAPRPEPVRIESLAAGVKAEQLKGVLSRAEALMKEGKYVSALEQYNTAAEVVPNNGLVMIGQAHAELAAGYYRKAEDHLRRAFEADPVLTMAQFDLRQSIGRERLSVLISDLKEIARKQEQDHGPVFLLAYLAYNTGAEQQAGMYLDLAQKRAGADDKLYRLLKMNWAIPAAQPAQPAR
jgi:tetratricopeptide (TPR) repeat protein